MPSRLHPKAGTTTRGTISRGETVRAKIAPARQDPGKLWVIGSFGLATLMASNSKAAAANGRQDKRQLL
jgi:hypothetical protein